MRRNDYPMIYSHLTFLQKHRLYDLIVYLRLQKHCWHLGIATLYKTFFISQLFSFNSNFSS